MKPLVKIGLTLVAGFAGLVLFLGIAGNGCRHATPPGTSVNLGKTETRSNFSSSSTSTSSDNSTFSARRVLLIVESPHPLSRRIGELLAQQLTNCPQIVSLEITDSPKLPAEGTQSPDLFVHINLTALEEDGVLTHATKATVTGSLGDAPWQVNRYTSDTSQPPLVQFDWNGTLETETTFSGVRSDRYAEVAHSIADQFTAAISNQIATLADKYPPQPEMPRAFYGPYQPVADFDFMRDVEARRADSYYGLLTHNETFWQFFTPTNPIPCLQRIISQLETAGWKIGDVSLTNTEAYYFYGLQGDARLEIFRQRDEGINFSSGEQSPTNFKFIVHYRKPFSRAEREAALDELLTGTNITVETLLPFRNSFSSAQRKQFYTLIEKSPAASPRAYLELAGVFLHRKDTNAALNVLIRAKALAPTLNDPSDLQSDIETLVKKISPKKKLKLEVTAQTYRDLGFLELTNSTQTIETERRLGQPLLLFGLGERGMKIYSLTLRPLQTDAYPWSMREAEEGSWGTSSSSLNASEKSGWEETLNLGQQRWKITALPQPDRQMVKFAIRTAVQ